MKPRGRAGEWRDGWWSGARAVPSPNVGERSGGEPPRLVVLHSISLPPGCYRGRDVERLFTNTLDTTRHPFYAGLRDLKVSAHFFIRRDGQVLQFAATTRRAWHAGVSSWRGRENCNDWSVGIELEGLEGRRFSAAQYRRLRQLLRAVLSIHPIEDVVGHEHVAPTRKRDPGPGFDWMRLARGVRGSGLRVWPLVDEKA